MPHRTTRHPTLLLLDDHPLYQVGFAHGLRAVRPAAQTLGATTLNEALALAGSHAVQVVLIDMHLDGPEASGVAALAAFAQQYPDVTRIIITGDTRPHLPRTCRAHGANAFMLKSADAATMWRIIDDAQAGQTRWLTDSDWAAGAPDMRLTPRQTQVLQHLSEGMSNKAIAAALGLTERAIKMHMTNMMGAAQASNRVDLLRAAREFGWLAE